MTSDLYEPTEPEYQPTERQLPTQVEGSASILEEQNTFRLGQVLLNQYEIFGKPRPGSFGLVLFVKDRKSGHRYAIKTYNAKVGKTKLGIEDFKAEVSFWLNLDPHPNIVKAHFVEVINGQPFLFMEYVESDDQGRHSLRHWMTGHHLTPDTAINYAYQLCLGMEFANKKAEITHSDLKPENILIDHKGILKITDFGLSSQVRIVDGKYPNVNAATWVYAPPEVFTKQQAVNTQSDIYSFGIILYEMLTNSFPYPFQLTQEAREQLSQFHTEQKIHEVAKEIYHTGVPNMYLHGAGRIIGTCVEHFTAQRYRDFSHLRESMEYEWQLKRPLYLNEFEASEDPRQKAVSLYKLGQYGEALTIFNRLLQSEPNNAQLLLDTARAIIEVGDRDAARKLLKKALTLDPQLEEAEILLDKIFFR